MESVEPLVTNVSQAAWCEFELNLPGQFQTRGSLILKLGPMVKYDRRTPAQSIFNTRFPLAPPANAPLREKAPVPCGTLPNLKVLSADGTNQFNAKKGVPLRLSLLRQNPKEDRLNPALLECKRIRHPSQVRLSMASGHRL